RWRRGCWQRRRAQPTCSSAWNRTLATSTRSCSTHCRSPSTVAARQAGVWSARRVGWALTILVVGGVVIDLTTVADPAGPASAALRPVLLTFGALITIALVWVCVWFLGGMLEGLRGRDPH